MAEEVKRVKIGFEYATQVPKDHVPVPWGKDHYYLKEGESLKQMGECTGEALEDFSQEGGPKDVPAWTFKFYSSITKKNFKYCLEKGKIYYNVSMSK